MKNSFILLLGILLFISCNTQRGKGPAPREHYPDFSYASEEDNHSHRPSQADAGSQPRNSSTDLETSGNTDNNKSGEQPTRHLRNKSKRNNKAAGQIETGQQPNAEETSGNSETRTETVQDESEGDSDQYLYMIAGLMGAAGYGFLRTRRKTALKATRWAKFNKNRSRVIIALLQLGIGGLGFLAGREFGLLGHSFSDQSQYIFSGLMGLSFLSLLRKRKNENLVLLDEFDRMKLGHLGMAIPFFLLSLGIGNRLESGQQQLSPSGYAIEQADHRFAAQDLPEPSTANDINAEPSDTTWLIVGYVFLALLLAVALFTLCCALICSGYEAVAMAGIIASIILMIFVIHLMVKSVQRRRTTG